MTRYKICLPVVSLKLNLFLFSLKSSRQAFEVPLIIDPSKNSIVCGDNLEWLKWIPNECVDLCYIDPPFFSNRNYEVIWGNGYELRSFGDRFAGGITHYVEWMRERVELIHNKLKPTGAIFLHCDWHASHRLRCLLDDIFDENNFRNEIIWKRTPFSGSSKAISKKLPSIHDTIFYYSKSKLHDSIFNCPTEPYPPEYLKRFNCEDKRGRYQKVLLKTYSKETLARLRSEDRIVEPKTKGAGLRYKQYLHESKGVRQLGDLWTDINMINPMGKERLGYPTQKPESLVKRIIELGSRPGDLILDCFAGGGTSAKVASETQRRFIVGDVSPVAIKLMAQRLNFECHSMSYEVKNLPQTVEEFQLIDGHKFAETICDLMGWEANRKKSSDGGIDGWDGEGNPVQIKNHSNAGVGRPEIQKFHSAIIKDKRKKGVFVAWQFARTALEYIAQIKSEHGIEIIAKPCSEVFGDLVIPHDKAENIKKLYAERLPDVWKDRQSNPANDETASPAEMVADAIDNLILEQKHKEVLSKIEKAKNTTKSKKRRIKKES